MRLIIPNIIESYGRPGNSIVMAKKKIKSWCNLVRLLQVFFFITVDVLLIGALGYVFGGRCVMVLHACYSVLLCVVLMEFCIGMYAAVRGKL